MLGWPKISPSQQPRSLGISPSDLASKSHGVKIEYGQVTWGKNSSDLGFKIGDRKRALTSQRVEVGDGLRGTRNARVETRPFL